MEDEELRDVLDIVWSKGVAYGIKSSHELGSDIVLDEAIPKILSLYQRKRGKDCSSCPHTIRLD
jgi:hypothetical protein